MDEAIWRRIRVIEFRITIPPEQQDKRLANRLISELPGILQWAMQGLIEWKEKGLVPPASVLQSTKKYREDNNTVGQWIESACFLDPQIRTSMKDLHDSYCSWCDDSSLDPLHNTLFGKELNRLGYKIFKAKRGNGRIGIGLKQPAATVGAVASRLSMPFPAQVSAPSTVKQSLN
jgi:putative DNA primase/helicase